MFPLLTLISNICTLLKRCVRLPHCNFYVCSGLGSIEVGGIYFWVRVHWITQVQNYKSFIFLIWNQSWNLDCTNKHFFWYVTSMSVPHSLGVLTFLNKGYLKSLFENKTWSCVYYVCVHIYRYKDIYIAL